MDSSVNAWEEIDRWLRLRHHTQSDLAARLGISSSAVTQIKKGINLFSAEQLRAVMEYLEIDAASAEEICCTIFRARLGNALPHPPAKLCFFEKDDPRSRWPLESDVRLLRTVPQVPVRRLNWYEPALESAESFVFRNAEGTAQISGDGDFLLTGLDAPSGTLALSCTRRIRSGERIFAKLRGGRMLCGLFHCSRGQAALRLEHPDPRILRWQRGADVNFFLWAFPVCGTGAGKKAD